MTIADDILRGAHPVAIMHWHQITAGMLQLDLLILAQRKRQWYPARLPELAEGTVRDWAPRFRALGHMGLENVP